MFTYQACHELQATLPVLWSSASLRRILTHGIIQILGIVRALHLGQTSPSPHCGCQYCPNVAFEYFCPELTGS